jgi:cytochrome P450
MRDALFDPLDARVLRDPYPAYRRLRETHPVYWHPQLNSWVLTRHTDCVAVLANSDIFAADFRRVGVPTPPPLLSLQTLDPPDQTPLRRFAQSAVRAQDFAALEEDARERAETLLEGLALRGRFDFVSDFADPFTLGVICQLLGVEPPARDEAWARLNDELDQSMDSGLVPEAEDAGLRAREAFSALVGRWLDSAGDEGVLGYVARNLDQAGVGREVLLNTVRAFWHAGFEVPSRFLCNAVLALLSHPGALDALRLTEALDRGIEELVRYAGPVQAVSRACTRETSLGGQTIRPGEVVVALLGAANRDPEVFDRPDELVLDRHPNPHLGFGRGAHACLGTPIARMEARVVLSTLLDRYPDLQLAGAATPRANATLRGPAALPITMGTPQMALGRSA